jgi:hypothetical protein
LPPEEADVRLLSVVDVVGCVESEEELLVVLEGGLVVSDAMILSDSVSLCINLFNRGFV